jgi:hypothetical protein
MLTVPDTFALDFSGTVLTIDPNAVQALRRARREGLPQCSFAKKAPFSLLILVRNRLGKAPISKDKLSQTIWLMVYIVQATGGKDCFLIGSLRNASRFI